MKWPLACVVKIYPGKDGKVHVATIEQRRRYERPWRSWSHFVRHEDKVRNCVVSVGGTGLTLKLSTLRAVNISPFEAIRAEMDKNMEGAEYLDYSGKALER